MKLIEIANKIDKSKDNSDWVNLSEIASALRVEYYDYNDQDKLKAYWIGSWCCTDTYVGYKMYFLNDEPVCVSVQSARKSDEEFSWFSKDAALKVRDFILSLVEEEQLDDFLDIIDINEEDIGEGYKISFNANIIYQKTAKLNDKNVKIIERVRKENDYGIDQELLIEFEDGSRLVEDINNLVFNFNILE